METGGVTGDMPVQNIDVNSLDELVRTVLDLQQELDAGHFLWYRGLTCSGFTLTPSLMRDAESIEAVLDRELRLLTRFRQRSLPYWAAGYPQSDWEHLFAMQHHGVPTRLLDWSENAFVALYFALEAADNHPHDGDCNPVLWCIDPVLWNRNVSQLRDYGGEVGVLTTVDEELEPYKPESSRDRLRKRQNTPVAVYGTHNSARIVAQRGTFTIAGKDLAPMEAFADEDGTKKKLWKVGISGDRQRMRNDLAFLGFTQSMIYPDLPGLARELTQLEGWRR